MKVEIEEISPVKKALRIEVPPEVVSQEVENAYIDLKKRVKLPGFRPGKVPLSVLEKKFGQEVQEDVLRKLIPDYYQKAVAEAGIHPVDLPAIERIELEKNKPLSFTATVEVRPTIDLQDYTGIRIARRKIEVQPADMERALEALREEHGQLAACEETHTVVKGDYVIIDFSGQVDGKPLELKGSEDNGDRTQISGYQVQVGSQSLLPGLEEGLLGRKKNEDYEQTIRVPDDHPNPAIRSKEIVFTIRIQEVKRKVLPDMDDEFAKDMGLASMERLKEKISSELQRRLEAEASRAEKNTLIQKLVERHRFEVPPSLVRQEVEHLAHSIKPSDASADNEAIRTELTSLATERVKASLILSAVADAETIQVSDQDLEEEIGRIADRLKTTVQEAKRVILSREKSFEGIRARLKEEKTVSRILEKAEIQLEPSGAGA